ncbi:MAG: peptidyl-prolyl cis-trans isomerase [Chitinispirillaceae bacterium]|nr:peptidyl-prolyl cis-trans isomerase [Chitinispirillaceae bacterium]
MTKRIVTIITAAGLSGITGCVEEANQVKLETTCGDIVIELDAKAAPKTAANFLEYVNSGFYDGTIFHRVIRTFMIQGGGFTPDMAQKPTKSPIANEAANGLQNLRGTVAMARTGEPHSATAQFFINTVDNPFLNHRSATPEGWGYCVFGKVVQGMEAVDSIAKTPTARKGMHSDVPVEPILIRKATVIKAGKSAAPAQHAE